MITKHDPFSPVLQLKDPLALLLVTLHVLSCRVAIASGKLHPTCVIHSPNLHYTYSPNLHYTYSPNLHYTHSPNLHYTHSPNLCCTHSPNLHYTHSPNLCCTHAGVTGITSEQTSCIHVLLHADHLENPLPTIYSRPKPLIGWHFNERIVIIVGSKFVWKFWSSPSSVIIKVAWTFMTCSSH